jgi:regulator of sigma E protease
MIIVTILFGIMGLGIIIFIHELGHFIAAKVCGIEVETFSLGWGKKLVGFTRGGTSYQVSWFPFGGYCKMKGEMMKGNQSEEEMERMRSEEGSFLAAPPWQRSIVGVSGPLANMIFAVIVLTLIWWIGFNVHSAGNRIILATDYSLDPLDDQLPAVQAGLLTGDRITAINDSKVDNFWEISEIVRTSPGQTLLFNIERVSGEFQQKRELKLNVTPMADPETGQGRIGIYAWIEPVIGRVERGKPGDLAGLIPGDHLVAVNGSEIRHDVDFYQTMKDSPDNVSISYRRGKSLLEGLLQLEYDKNGNLDLGITFQYEVFRSPRLGIIQSSAQGFRRTFETLGLAARGLWQLVRLKVKNLNQVVAGPIRITKMVGDAAVGGFSLGLGEGFVSYFQFLCLLSVVIALMNLLPIPALDGGLIMLSVFEWIRKKPLKLRFIWRFQVFGFLIIMMIIVMAMLSDILFLVG